MRPHPPQMSQNSFLARDVGLERLSELTKNFSGAEIEGLVKDAVAYALNRQVGARAWPHATRLMRKAELMWKAELTGRDGPRWGSFVGCGAARCMPEK